MSLRIQLLAFGLVTLALPWAGLRFVEQMEAALRAGLEAALLGSAGTVAAAMADRVAGTGFASAALARADTAAAATIYAHRLVGEPRVDGFRDDWNFARRTGVPSGAALDLGADQRLWSGVSGRFAYIYVEVDDDDLVYGSSPSVSPIGDRVALLAGSDAWLLTTAAPGSFRAQRTDRTRFVPAGQYEERVLAAWQENAGGYAVEVRLPLALLGGRLGVAVIDVDPVAGGYSVGLAATWQGNEAVAGPFVHEQPDLGELLASFSRAGDRYRVVGPDGWVLADTGAVNPMPDIGDLGSPLAEGFFRWVLRRDDPLYDGLESPPGRLGDVALRAALDGRQATAWYRQSPTGNAVVAAAVPIDDPALGAVLLEQASDSVLTLTNQALMRVMSFTVLVSVFAAAGLLGYATFLSVRVRRLAQAAESALGPRGEITVALPGGRARDEIGDLSRSFQLLLGRLRDYTGYLRTLTGKLTHELRTPLAIVSTSVDNLEHEVGSDEARTYVERLRQGVRRLETILSAMSAATRVEQAVDETPASRFDLGAVVESCTMAYRDVYAERRFTLALPERACEIAGSSELMAQLLDKLVENAVSFSEPGSTIDVAVTELRHDWELAVANRGPLLPESMRHQLFDSLVAVREPGRGGTHLGLGLYIVALVARYHGGGVEADNLPDASGVVVRVRLPRSDAADRPRA